MSTVNVFSVRDQKANGFLQPFYLPNESVAYRAMYDCLSDPEHQFTKHPEDYSLYHLGEFDFETGKFTTHDTPEHIVSLAVLYSKTLSGE